MSFETHVPTEARDAMQGWFNRQAQEPLPFTTAIPEFTSMTVPTASALDAQPQWVDLTEVVGNGEAVVRDTDPITRATVVVDGGAAQEQYGAQPHATPRGAGALGEVMFYGTNR